MEDSWRLKLNEEFDKQYFINIRSFLRDELSAGKIIFPPGRLLFNAFNRTPFEQVKVIILGQDPYHGPGQAMGLCFSVNKGVKQPASLKNIYKELSNDVGFKDPGHGDLSEWADQGVFLLNAMLTVERGKPGSHSKIGWQIFTDKVINILSEESEGLVFLLWGRFAQSKKKLINEFKHYVLESPHPSPLAGGGFFGNHHFSKTNDLLSRPGKKPIKWQLTPLSESKE